MRVLLTFLTMLLAVNQAAQAQEESHSIARSLFPTDIIEYPEQSGTAPAEAVSLSYDHLGAPRIIAAYTNGFSAAVQLIDCSEPPRVISVFRSHGLTGSRLSIEPINFLEAEENEFLVRLHGPQGGTLDWIFSTSDDHLRLISPIRAEHLGITQMINASYQDLDGDGTIEAVARWTEYLDEHDLEVDRVAILDSNGEGLLEARPVLFFQSFGRGGGKPQVARFEFSSDVSEGTLVIFNKLGADGPPASPGWIKLNGAQVQRSPDFLRDTIRRPVHLQSLNVLEVELSEVPEGGIAVAIEP